ncbi:hypothetical protein EV363DRAFT_1374225 [Boletus edulis]|nr:hypothetical protein EV363DRAFT_1374225 [Boletus edulis]
MTSMPDILTFARPLSSDDPKAILKSANKLIWDVMKTVADDKDTLQAKTGTRTCRNTGEPHGNRRVRERIEGRSKGTHNEKRLGDATPCHPTEMLADAKRAILRRSSELNRVQRVKCTFHTNHQAVEAPIDMDSNNKWSCYPPLFVALLAGCLESKIWRRGAR